ncbi:sugar transferase [Ruminococcus albus]|uniref:Sugar transferase n=1 Tax=Ruminococcus albus (strain ATCC 27210 / DSM 20455 / JCM 14654 / NCDO 2250 / 7) TaxID=697329 RepID=E6UKU3_RUMA7|nr:sugar transferase [Ruminococcus albus]ADU24289.1 sugar transferase [Ruminococcus albus 7 = DSM 20455]
MSDFKKKLIKTATYSGVALGAAFVVMRAIAKKQKPKSEYADRPEEQNPMKGKKVVFVEDNNDPINADGKNGHLEAVGVCNHTPTFYEKYVKRGLDVVLSFGGMVVLSPLYAFAAIAIKCDDPGPAIFKQKRVAQSKGYFELMKLLDVGVA